MGSSAFAQVAGAVLDEQTGVPAHFGAPLREQRAFADGKALIDAGFLSVVTVSGADRLTWIDSMTSGMVRALAPGESAETLLLSPQGHIEQALRVVDDGSMLYLLVDRSRRDSLVEFLRKMRFAMRVEIAVADDDYALIAGRSDGQSAAADAVRDFASLTWRDPWAELVPGGVQYADADYRDYALEIMLVPRDSVGRVFDIAETQGLRFAGLDALNALEIEAHRPSIADLDERALPHEFDWLRTAVHLRKGCYRGQETVAKVHNLGHPPRRFTMLHLDGSSSLLPETEALIYPAPDAEAKPVGRITRAALHYELGPIALALLKRATDETADLWVKVGDELIAATQEVIVPQDAGRVVEIPKELRQNAVRRGRAQQI